MDERRGGGEAEEGGKRRRKGGGKYYKESLRKCEMRVASSTTYTRDKKRRERQYVLPKSLSHIFSLFLKPYLCHTSRNLSLAFLLGSRKSARPRINEAALIILKQFRRNQLDLTIRVVW